MVHMLHSVLLEHDHCVSACYNHVFPVKKFFVPFPLVFISIPAIIDNRPYYHSLRDLSWHLPANVHGRLPEIKAKNGRNSTILIFTY